MNELIENGKQCNGHNNKNAKESLKMEGIPVKGFFRLQIGDNNGVVGDSGWVQNEVMNDGFQDYIVKTIGGIAGSKQVSHLAIGTGTAPNVTHSSLDGETKRGACTNSVVSSKTLQCTVAFASNDHPTTESVTIANIGLFNTSAGGSLLCGNVFDGSAWATNQGVSATYQLQFGTTA